MISTIPRPVAARLLSLLGVAVLAVGCATAPATQEDAVRARADEMLSFGRITLPHNLARVVLLEQIYRACKISRGEPYHK